MLTRRQLLSNLSLTAVGAGVSLSALAQEPANPQRTGKVIVVGGGLSGLVAAFELASRGVEVEIIEAQSHLGGRARTGPEAADQEALAPRFAPFLLPGQAHTAREVLSRLGLFSAMSEDWERPAFLLDGRRFSPQEFGGRVKILAALWKRARSQGDRMIPMALRQGKRWNSSLSVEDALATLGGQSAATWHAAGAPLTPWKAFREIFSPLVFNASIQEVDAASFALAEQFYSGPESGVQRLIGDPETQLWKPFREALEAMGVRFRMGVEVTELSFSGGRVSGLTLGGFGEGSWVEEVPKGWTEIPRKETSPVRIFRDSAGVLKAFAGRPRFGEDPGLYVVEGADGIHIEGEDLRSHFSADNVILACGAESAWALAGDVLGLKRPPLLRERVRALFAISAALPPKLPEWILPEQGRCVSARVLPTEVENEWIVSLEAVSFNEDDAATLDLLAQEIGGIWPEFAHRDRSQRALARWSVPVPEPGWAQKGFSVQGGMPGLVSAGEHLFHGVNVQGFEAAARSGQFAARSVLKEMGLD
jgi:hypothetical protein